jgi:hypothetical protein
MVDYTGGWSLGFGVLLLLFFSLLFVLFLLDALLLELLGLVVEGIDDFVEVGKSLNGSVEHLAVFFSFVEDQAVAPLVESAFNFSIKNHFGKLMEDLVNG